MLRIFQRRQLPRTDGSVHIVSPAEVVFDIIKNQLPPGISRDDFLSFATRYSFIPVFQNGAIVGAYANDGPLVHAAVLPSARGKWFSKRVFAWLRKIMQTYGKIITTVEEENQAGHSFVSRIGFVEVKRNAGVVHYELRGDL